MNKLALRNKLALMTRKQHIKLTHGTLNVSVAFSEEGMFEIELKSSNQDLTSTIKTPSLKSAVAFLYAHFKPGTGNIYQHSNGNIYTVIGIANEDSVRPEYPPTVIYQGSNGKLWAKPLDNFEVKMWRIK